MNPYRELPPRSFWRTAVAEADPLAGLWTPKFAIGQDDPIITAGSCFARRIGRALLDSGLNWYVTELPPPGLTAAERARRQFGEFSFRTGNIYTAATLRQWLAWAYGEAEPPGWTWRAGERHLDPFRPAVEPDGYADAAEVAAARAGTLAAIRRAVDGASCLIFTLGLTEAWLDRADGVVFQSCPGTVGGTFDGDRHGFVNFGFVDVYRDLSAAVALCRAANPGLRVVLTVSPVPLTATATGGHALVANTYSKSVLRAVAGQLAAEHDHVDYFPSYELITGARVRFFEDNLRTVTSAGFDLVLRHFLDGIRNGPARPSRAPGADTPEEVACEDAVLDYYRR